MSNFFDRVYDVVRTIPRGTVLSYGQVAALAGNPRASRAVGWALHVNPEPGDAIPCHRVVYADGRLTRGFAFGGADVQKALLEAEGVQVSADYIVDMEKYNFKGQLIE